MGNFEREGDMTVAYRVVLFLTLWLAVWAGAGVYVGSLFGTLGTGGVTGFLLGVATTLLWPWLLPRMVDNWMDDNWTDARTIPPDWSGVRTSTKPD
jgi:hypothetical protein